MIVLVDAGLTPFWVPFVQSHQVTSIHWSNVGRGDAPDSELLEWAAENEAIILTADGDFTDLLAVRHLSGPSVIYLRTNERNPSGPGASVLEACKTLCSRGGAGLVITIDQRGSRVRALPIQIEKRHH